MFKLVIEDDEGNKTVVPIIRDEITIGRQDGNTIRLTERNVSRKHARLVRDNGAVFLEDVDARYGTRKNGERIDGRTEFNMGDVFTIGDYRLTLQTEASAEGKAKPPPKPNGAAPPPPEAARKKGNDFSNQPTKITKIDDAEQSGPDEGTAVLPKDPARLVIVSSNFAGQEFPLARKEMVIGRGEECDIIIDHRSVSQKHAKVVREQGGDYKIVDLKSKNGVKVGGEEYRAVHLKRGDIVELGHVKFRFVEPGENYVFTPQSEAEAEFAPRSNKGPLLLVLGVLVIGAAAIGYYWMQGKSTDTPKDDTVSVSKKVADPTPPPDPVKEADGPEEKVDAFIAEAEAAYREGRIPDVMAQLKAARMLDVTPEQDDRIAELRSKAVREKQPAKHLSAGRDDLARGDWIDALESFGKIPPEPRTRVYDAMDKEGLKQKAIDGAIAEARELADDEEFDDAAELLDELAGYASEEHAEELASVRTDVERMERKANKPQPKSNTPRPPKPKPDPPPKVNGEVMMEEAMAAFRLGDWPGTISNCKKALTAGKYPTCVRLIAVSYNKKGDKKNACKWAGRANNAAALRDDFGCE